MTNEEFVETFTSAPDEHTRQALLEEHKEFLKVDTVYALKERADILQRDNAHQVLNVGLAAEKMAEGLSSDEAHALALWMQANAYHHLAQFESAVRCYERAAALFKAAGKPLEAARTNIGQMFTRMTMGQFEYAQLLAEATRLVFIQAGDTRSRAKIDMNLGHLHRRQGHSMQALEYYKQATETFQSLGDPLYAAMTQVNQAVALTELDIFLGAEMLYEQARPVFESKKLRGATASVDFDLACLRYYRGNYGQALRTFERARDTFVEISDRINIARTDLEESDLYLDLNLPDETLHLAGQAEGAFEQMGMPFESGRARANHAAALARLGQRASALAVLEQARALFASQDNQAWTAHVDLQRAEILRQEGQNEQARLLACTAARAYAKLDMKTKETYAHILSATLWADESQWEAAFQELQFARKALGKLAAPWLEQRIETCAGRIHEGLGQIDEALEHYQHAASEIENIVATLTAEEQRTAFVADKLAPYEALVTLYSQQNPAAAFQWAEQAKSRALVDMLAAGLRPRLRITDKTDARQGAKLQELREELNWLYTRLTRGTAPGESGAPAAEPGTWTKVQEREREATSLWRELQARHAEELSLIRVAPLQPQEIQSKIPENTLVVEYFIARGQVNAFVLGPDSLRVYPALTPLASLLPLLEELAFQLSKFQYGPSYYRRHRQVLLENTQRILDQLGEKLLRPLWEQVYNTKAIIIVPHGPLHALPFQTLRVENHYLIETHAISYAPSAAVLKFCWDKPVSFDDSKPFAGKPLLVGLPDERAYHVTEEIQALGKLFGEADILLEEQATFEQVQQFLPHCGILHLATHGLFRPEAPLLSSIHLADRWLAVQDVYDLDLQAGLVTLSACETGLGRDAGGDDLVGLVRGFLYAGAASLLVSLWTVDDESTACLVTDFYRQWLAGVPKAQALRQAQLTLLKEYEHPYYWAPLVLIGNEK